MKTWILVANSAEAKIFVTDNLRKGELELVQEFTHPASRKKAGDLMADKPGHYKTDTGVRGAYNKSEPKEVEAEHFALQLIHALKTDWDQHKFQHLIVVTPAHFNGLLKKHLQQLSELEITHVPKDYTKYTTQELKDSLQEQLFG